MGKSGVEIKMIKSEKKSIFLHKIICCGCVLESPHRGDSNTHPKHMILWTTSDNYGKTLVYQCSENKGAEQELRSQPTKMNRFRSEPS